MYLQANDNSDVVSRLREIERILLELQSRVPELEGLTVVSREGLPIASMLFTTADEDRICAMTAANLSLSDRMVQELERGKMDQLIITGTDGLIIIRDAGEHAVLVGIAKTNAKLGLVLLEIKRAAQKLSGLI